MASIFIIDDHPVARLAVRMLLENAGHQIVGEVDDGLRALQHIRNMQPTPDIVVVDLDIPGLSGIELMEKLRHGGFDGGLLVLTGRDDDHYVSRCQGAGADAFVSKRNNLEELADAVRAIERGYGYFPLKRQAHGAPSMFTPDSEVIAGLSNRELQVLQHLARGVRVIDISQQMHISTKTVSTYKRRIFEKVGVDSTLALVDFARRHNLDV
ncbi:response regulator [Serratia odorifera]|nr:response regulator [Serratia odorifera]MBJ2066867.1 response regulator [Serratia odorifera]PNK92949.1 DNA-binding response regulator [Serratia odorifera]RII71998.1 DNA-binding response regulator [Serratia odorifera]VDZ57552.1 Virulence factors putative positive transcription regulator BvgA [Serratia odorifera]HEJ9097013.1 response regulator [Serratia odorifera]